MRAYPSLMNVKEFGKMSIPYKYATVNSLSDASENIKEAIDTVLRLKPYDQLTSNDYAAIFATISQASRNLSEAMNDLCLLMKHGKESEA